MATEKETQKGISAEEKAGIEARDPRYVRDAPAPQGEVRQGVAEDKATHRVLHEAIGTGYAKDAKGEYTVRREAAGRGEYVDLSDFPPEHVERLEGLGAIERVSKPDSKGSK